MAKKKATQHGNSRVVQVTWRSIIAAKAFGKGFREVKKGKPFNDDGLKEKEQWGYERGRLFGVVYDGQLKNGRTVLAAAIYALAQAYNDKVFT